jgi:hypothetical protein
MQFSPFSFCRFLCGCCSIKEPNTDLAQEMSNGNKQDIFPLQLLSFVGILASFQNEFHNQGTSPTIRAVEAVYCFLKFQLVCLWSLCDWLGFFPIPRHSLPQIKLDSQDRGLCSKFQICYYQNTSINQSWALLAIVFLKFLWDLPDPALLILDWHSFFTFSPLSTSCNSTGLRKARFLGLDPWNPEIGTRVPLHFVCEKKKAAISVLVLLLWLIKLTITTRTQAYHYHVTLSCITQAAVILAYQGRICIAL